MYRANFLERVLAHPVIGTLGLIATLIAVGTPIYEALLQPDIYFESPGQISEPLSAPFTIKNRSWLFTMQDTKLHCMFDKLIVTTKIQFGKIFMYSPALTIPSSGEDSFRCRIGKLPNDLMRFSTGDFLAIHVYLSADYDTLGFSRESVPTEFTWYTKATPPRWVKGKIAD